MLIYAGAANVGKMKLMQILKPFGAYMIIVIPAFEHCGIIVASQSIHRLECYRTFIEAEDSTPAIKKITIKKIIQLGSQGRNNQQ